MDLNIKRIVLVIVILLALDVWLSQKHQAFSFFQGIFWSFRFQYHSEFYSLAVIGIIAVTVVAIVKILKGGR